MRSTGVHISTRHRRYLLPSVLGIPSRLKQLLEGIESMAVALNTVWQIPFSKYIL